MAATEGTAAFGITVHYATTSGGAAVQTFTDITDVTPVGESVDAIEMTHHTSPNGYTEFIPGIKNAEGFEFKGNLVHGASENRAYLRAVLGLRKFWTITFPNGAKVEIDGFLSEFTPEPMGAKDKQAFSAKVTRASAAPTWTEAA